MNDYDECCYPSEAVERRTAKRGRRYRRRVTELDDTTGGGGELFSSHALHFRRVSRPTLDIFQRSPSRGRDWPYTRIHASRAGLVPQ